MVKYYSILIIISFNNKIKSNDRLKKGIIKLPFRYSPMIEKLLKIRTSLNTSIAKTKKEECYVKLINCNT